MEACETTINVVNNVKKVLSGARCDWRELVRVDSGRSSLRACRSNVRFMHVEIEFTSEKITAVTACEMVMPRPWQLVDNYRKQIAEKH